MKPKTNTQSNLADSEAKLAEHQGLRKRNWRQRRTGNEAGGRAKKRVYDPVFIGAKYGHWTVLDGPIPSNSGNKWMCICSCGTMKTCFDGTLKIGASKSCGCRQYESVTTHGCCKTITYASWSAMKTRCLNPMASDYHRYGGRGITICRQWIQFQGFLKDMGERPSLKHSLDRIDVNGNYEPGNCKWSTHMEQCYNKRCTKWVEFNGEILSAGKLANRMGIHMVTFYARLADGWSVERAATQPINKSKRNKKALCLLHTARTAES